MRASPRIVAVVVAVVVAAGSFPNPVHAQEVSVRLVPVHPGRIDALSEDVISREMCLRGGTYVLAVARGPLSGNGVAIIATGTLEQAEETVAGTFIRESDQTQHTWQSFRVTENRACMYLTALNARARVYELRVGVAW